MNIYIKNAFKEYHGNIALEIDDLSFEKGNIYALVGLNGSGKSTLLQCASGLNSFTKGEVLYNGVADITSVRKNISVMTQNPYLFDCSAEENIKLGLKFRKFKNNEIEDKLNKYLPCFDIGALLKKNAKKLSGGEQAKIALLRTAVLETEITFLDEPTASMDIESTIRAEKLIESLASENKTVILVTHDLYQVERMANYVVFLDKGKIIEKGEKSRVFSSPRHYLVKQILGKNR